MLSENLNINEKNGLAVLDYFFLRDEEIICIKLANLKSFK
jgi:hypothetical protein